MINNLIFLFILLLMIIAYYFYTSTIGDMIRIYSNLSQIMEYA